MAKVRGVSMLVGGWGGGGGVDGIDMMGVMRYPVAIQVNLFGITKM